ncbi:pyridoxine/pyridoxamine 5'-phosphate oxidase [Pontibacter vulgaris]|uniref:pyridoxine/pyridoxamine 5'-phosphate oxidase n=1 Tax=Pontibacter vulgaris TaxID=2905679 RepID=UPI001FA73563
MNPIMIFQRWLQEELNLTQVRIPTACCLSTIGLDNYPNARFVSLKEVSDDSFVITGPLNSRKGLEINLCNKVALTFWWVETERQVRIQGEATQISKTLADKYFSERNKDSQIISIVSKQGHVITDVDGLIEEYNRIEQSSGNNKLRRPEYWGGYTIKPARIEFLEFKTTRFHNRDLYTIENQKWVLQTLQP